MPEPRLVVAGYIAASRGVRQAWQDPLFVPERFITASECLADDLDRPEFWAWHTERGAVVGHRLPLLAVAFAEQDAAALIDDVAELPGATAVDLLVRASPPPPDARLRGFELVGIEYAVSSMHSWLCHGYEAEVAEALGIRQNAWGLLDDYADASAVLAWMDALPADQAPEPVLWTVAAIMECVSPSEC